MVKLHDIYKSFNHKRVLNGVSLEIAPSDIVGMIGPSGGGKSILLKIIAGVVRADSGSVSSGEHTENGIGLMFQEGALFDSLTVFDNVAFALVSGRVPSVTLPKGEREVVYDKVSEVLSRVGLSHAALKMPGQISGGMRRRASLARALVNRPSLLLLDDPTSGLDPVASKVIMNLIVELHDEYKPTTIMVSHDLRRLFPAVRQVVALFDGKIIFQDSVQELAKRAHSTLTHFVTCRYDLARELDVRGIEV
jgi:phospholipid/cholesterol/gamma-HCH transport system ATP-binding protein